MSEPRITPEWIEAQLALCEAATFNWYVSTYGLLNVGRWAVSLSGKDARFASAARTGYPAVLQELTVLRQWMAEAVSRMEEAHDRLVSLLERTESASEEAAFEACIHGLIKVMASIP